MKEEQARRAAQTIQELTGGAAVAHPGPDDDAWYVSVSVAVGLHATVESGPHGLRVTFPDGSSSPARDAIRAGEHIRHAFSA